MPVPAEVSPPGNGAVAVEVPLLSVIIRSMDRPTLGDALASLAGQTHPRLEAVVVNAKGGEHSPLPMAGPGREFRLIGQGGPAQGRAAACNLGLQAVRGEWVLFLDDDDLLLPDHLARLLTALLGQSGASPCRAAYAGVQVEECAEVYDRPYDKAALLAANFLPIHAVLFARSLLDEGCAVSTALPLFEDWDFWLQIASRTDYLHVPGVSAIYRRALGASLHAQDDARRAAALVTFYRRWHERADAGWWAAAAVLQDRQRESLQRYAQQQQERVTALEQENASYQAETQDLVQQRAALQVTVTELEARLDALTTSTSWRLTAPLRAFRQWLRDNFGGTP